jgi:DNA-binding MarR family transcriptional regulator
MSDSPQSTARLVLETFPALMQAVQAEIRKVDHLLPPMPHYRALKLLRQSGPLTLGDLAAHCKVSMPTMSHTVTVMMNNGLVERIADPDDRRRVEVTLTADGAVTLERMEQHMVELVAEFFSKLSSDELSTLTRGFEVLRLVSEGRSADGVAEPAHPAESPTP